MPADRTAPHEEGPQPQPHPPMQLSINRLQFPHRPCPYWLRELACRPPKTKPSPKHKSKGASKSSSKNDSTVITTQQTSKVSARFKQNVKHLEVIGESIDRGEEAVGAEQTFRGEGYARHELINYAVGFLREGQFFLLPIDHTYEMMRVQSPNTAATAAAASTDNQSPLGPTPSTPLPIRIRFARMESDAYRRRKEQSSLYKHNLAKRDPWKQLRVQRTEAMSTPSICISAPPPQKIVLAIDANVEEPVGAAEPSTMAAIRPPPPTITVPGAMICTSVGFMRGHGSYADGDNLVASVAGAVEHVNKLVRVKPVKSRYYGEVGDIVIGRVIEVQQKRWKVETNSRLDSMLLLASVNLPGGELRRKSIEDELAMREYLREGDLVSAEVQQRFNDGAISLHTRNLKYGKLGQGLLVRVLPHLVKRRKNQFCNLPFGASVIFGCNGYIWISKIIVGEADAHTGGYVEDTQPIPRETREVIARVANCVRLLADNSVSLFDTSLIHAYNTSTPYQARDLIRPEIADEVAAEALRRMRAEG